ncbi:hypothetical protein CHS0354_008146 [Potamilus streckersoni]|uniref:Uncharacterized protein n=1 Tax=Potamilus streckersoni TaxID=2493646 RepID=A0AAE0SII0_9BIVA|nr:hypothetical protein CHS0354_008146 [Potamilus streckersoni]
MADGYTSVQSTFGVCPANQLHGDKVRAQHGQQWERSYSLLIGVDISEFRPTWFDTDSDYNIWRRTPRCTPEWFHQLNHTNKFRKHGRHPIILEKAVMMRNY